jgi:hypothetical protein
VIYAMVCDVLGRGLRNIDEICKNGHASHLCIDSCFKAMV